MANLFRIYISDNGLAKTGLTPTFQTLLNVDDGSAFTPPTITEIGGGWYKFSVALVPFEHIVGVVDAGSALVNNSERFIPVDARYSDFDFDRKQIFITPSFDELTDTVTFIVFTLINGKILTTELTSITVEVFNETHVSQFSLVTTSFTNGVAVLTKTTPGFTADRGFYAKATLVTTNETVISTDSFYTLQ